MKKIFIPLIIITLFSCKNKKAENDFYVIDLSHSVQDKIQNRIFSLDDIITDKAAVIPLETNDTVLLSSVYIGAVSSDFIFIENDMKLYIFNSGNGKIHNIIRGKGTGPEEYLCISDFDYDERLKTIYLYDGMGKKMNQYTIDGEFISSKKNDMVGGFSLVDDTIFFVSYPPLLKEPYQLGIYNKQWQLIKNYIPKKETTSQKSILFYDDFLTFNHKHFFKQSLGDTLYSVAIDTIKPFLVLSKGGLKIPMKLAADITKKKERSKYITNEIGYLVDTFYFLSYYYNNSVYYDIWDIKTSTILYRSIADGQNPNPGIHVTINNVKVNVWPKYVFGNTIYCVVDAQEALEIFPHLSIDDNPVIISMALKPPY